MDAPADRREIRLSPPFAPACPREKDEPPQHCNTTEVDPMYIYDSFDPEDGKCSHVYSLDEDNVSDGERFHESDIPSTVVALQ